MSRGHMSFNPLTNNNWKLVLQRAPNLEFRCTYATIPTMTLPPAQTPSPIVQIPYWGDHIEYAQLSIEFLLDEKLETYQEIYSWIQGLGRNPGYDAFVDLKNQAKSDIDKQLKSDISVSVMSSSGQLNREFIFHDAFPIYLGGFNLTVRDNDVRPLTSTAAFAYTYYSLI